MLRLLGAAVLTVIALFGTFTMTAQPAQALYCFNRFLGCQFYQVQDFGGAICCVYVCPDGSEKVGVCEQY
ncbi:MAG TPA: hypothetical protein VLT87_21305 [Thermoanaerobaculia bacterium]|nr:hypothetical protein [Thermoanaerobaculia bacterium]